MPIVSCKICGKRFYAKPSWLKRGWGKYCSSKCQHKAQLRGKFVYCEICGKKIWRTPRKLKLSKSKKFFCSQSHHLLWRNSIQRGERHPNWTGGKYVEYKKILERNKVKLKEFLLYIILITTEGIMK